MINLIDDTLRISKNLINYLEIACLDLHLLLCKLSEFPITQTTLNIIHRERIILKETCSILKELFKGCIKKGK